MIEQSISTSLESLQHVAHFLPGCQSIALLLGPPISGYILGTNPAKQMGNYKYAIIMNGLLMVLATGFAVGARLYQSKKLWDVI
jgi:hypothetical protein